VIQAGETLATLETVNRFGAEPSRFMVYISVLPSLERASAIFEPSGDHAPVILSPGKVETGTSTVLEKHACKDPDFPVCRK